MINSPRYILTTNKHSTWPEVPTVFEEIKKTTGKLEAILPQHPNMEVNQFLHNNYVRRPKETKPMENWMDECVRTHLGILMCPDNGGGANNSK